MGVRRVSKWVEQAHDSLKRQQRLSTSQATLKNKRVFANRMLRTKAYDGYTSIEEGGRTRQDIAYLAIVANDVLHLLI